MTLTLSSTSFRHAGTISREHTCDGANRSPAFAWSGVPEGTQSLLLVCDAPDAPRGTFHHWAAFNNPTAWKGLEPGYGAGNRGQGFQEALIRMLRETEAFTAPGEPRCPGPRNRW